MQLFADFHKTNATIFDLFRQFCNVSHVMENEAVESSFLKTLRIDPSLPCATERYFKARIVPESNQCILVHSNRLCLITIAPTHPILSEGLKIESINFESGSKQNRLNNKVSGKFKRGGQKLKQKSVLCVIKTVDGREHVIYSCVTGTLVEINKRLLENPNLLRDKPWSEGYIGIILPPFPSAGKRASKEMLD